ncbi:DUF3510 domain-containing protein [Durusdinium trenchii]|uniref:DUF3510 domain-containing protein n=1 Tax=Durusdinium trenchii TaxID=1381693 RepID=A0ABP0P7I9_9DINO
MEFGARKEKEGRRLWYGQAFNLDEASEWLKNLSLIGCPGEKSKATSINPHTSTLNTLIARGKTKRAARTSTSYEGKASQRVSFSVLGNGHPTRIIAMERNLEGQHTAATRERFMMCVNSSVARRDALPESMLVADPDLPAFTWLPLTTLQAAIFKREGVVNNPEYFANSVAESQDADQEGYPIAFPDGVPSRIRYKVQTDDRGQNLGMQTEFRISGRWHMKDPTDRIQLGAKRVTEHFRSRPHSVLAMEEVARKLLLGCSDWFGSSLRLRSFFFPARPPPDEPMRSAERGKMCERPQLEALHAGAAAHHGQMSAAIAVLALASGSGSFDAAGNLMVASRLVELNLQIRRAFRGPLPPSGERPADSDSDPECIAKPVHGFGSFAAPAATQPCPALHTDEASVPVAEAAVEEPPEDERAEDVSEAALTFDQLLPEEQFFQRGLGEGDAMIFDDSKFKDQALLRKVLLSGQSELKLSRVVDLYHHG